MAHLLLISDTERVKRVFAAYEHEDAVQLATAATLVQAEQAIAASVPDLTFVQSRISGFSGDIILRHLRKILPEDAPIVLLAADAADLEQAVRLGELHLDLTQEDEALSRAIAALLAVLAESGDVTAGAGATGARPLPAGKGKAGAEPKPRSKSQGAAQAKEPAHAQSQPGDDDAQQPGAAAPQQQGPAEPSLPERAEPLRETVPAADAPGPAGSGGGGGRVLGNPLLAEAYAHGKPVADLLAQEERKKKRRVWLSVLLVALAFIAIPAISYLAGRRAAPPEPAAGTGSMHPAKHPSATGSAQAGAKHAGAPTPAASPAPQATGAAHPATPQPVPAAPAVPAVPGGPAVSAGPAGSVAHPSGATAPAGKPAAAGASTGKPPVPTAAALPPKPAAPVSSGPAHPAVPPQPAVAAKASAPPHAAPAVPAAPAHPGAPAGPAAKQASAAPAPHPAPPAPAAPSPKAGASTLPSLVAHAKPDPAYALANPGWQRYLGSTMEYKVLREGQVYRALQVQSRGGEPVPEPIFAKLLLDFTGVTKYRLVSSAVQGDDLVEQGETSRGVSVTTHRTKAARRLKSFTFSYR